MLLQIFQMIPKFTYLRRTEQKTDCVTEANHLDKSMSKRSHFVFTFHIQAA